MPFFNKFMDASQPVFEANASKQEPKKQKFSEKLVRLVKKIREGVTKYLGTAEEIMSNV